MAFGGFGWSTGGRVISNTPTRYMFIDGNYFLLRVEEIAKLIKYPGKPYEIINFSNMIAGHERAFFFDSYPHERSRDFQNKKTEKEEIFKIINLTKDFRVSHGLSRYSGEDRRLRQKGVDVLLAITAYQHAIRGNMDIATIVAGDLDFLPLFEALSETRVRTQLDFYYKRPPHDLIQSADAIRMITPYSIHNWIKQEIQKKYINLGHVHDKAPVLSNVEKYRAGDRTIVVGLDEQRELFCAYIEGATEYYSSLVKEVATSALLIYPDTELKIKE